MIKLLPWQIKDMQMRQLTTIKRKCAWEKLKKKENNLLESLTIWKNLNEMDLTKKCKTWGWFVSVVLIGIPYVALMTAIEITKGAYSTWPFSSFLYDGLLVLISSIAGVVFAKRKNVVLQKVRKYLETRNKNFQA